MNCTVVVITRNRPLILRDCLEHVLSQDGAPLEVVVVDASDSADTELMVRSYPAVRYIDLRGAVNQMPRSRNEGIKAAQGEVIAFIDDDSMVQRGWLSAILRHYGNAATGGAGGLVLAPDEEARVGGVVGKLNTRGTPIANFNVRTDGAVMVDHLMGCNMSFRRRILLELGGFDERYDGSNFREETDMCVRVRRRGYNLLFDPDAAVVHLYARKEGFGRDDRVDQMYRFSVAKNTTYFRLKHFGKGVSLTALPANALLSLVEAGLRRRSWSVALAQITGLGAGVGAYLESLKGRRREPPTS